MMLLFYVWCIAMVVFLLGDLLWLSLVMKSFFIAHMKHLMIVSENGFAVDYISAFLAYSILVAALVWFVIVPCINSSQSAIFFNGAFLGFCIYGVYECTNFATLSSWSLPFLLTDIAWGTGWCGVTAVLVVMIIRFLGLI